MRLNAEGAFGHNFADCRSRHLSSYVFRLAFNDVFTQAVNSKVKSKAFLSNTANGFFSDAVDAALSGFRGDAFGGDVVTILHAPQLGGSRRRPPTWPRAFLLVV